MLARTRNHCAWRYALPFDIVPTRRDICQELVQRYPLFLLYPGIETVLQRLLLLLSVGGTQES
jgi:hypothetical protein